MTRKFVVHLSPNNPFVCCFICQFTGRLTHSWEHSYRSIPLTFSSWLRMANNVKRKKCIFFHVEINIPIAHGCLQVVSLLCRINVEVVIDSVAQSTVKRKKNEYLFFQSESYTVFKWFFSFSHGHHWCDPQKCQNSSSYLLKSVQFSNYFLKFVNTFDGQNI